MPKEYPRKLRVNTQIQRELADLVRDEIKDPRVKGATITKVDVSPDLRQARVYVSQLAIEAHPEGAVAALKHAAGHLRHELGRRLKMRFIPQLHFVVDRALAEGDHISKLIREAVTEDRQSAKSRGEDGDES